MELNDSSAYLTAFPAPKLFMGSGDAMQQRFRTGRDEVWHHVGKVKPSNHTARYTYLDMPRSKGYGQSDTSAAGEIEDNQIV